MVAAHSRSPFAYPTGFVIATFPLSPKLFCQTPSSRWLCTELRDVPLRWHALSVILERSEPLLFCLCHWTEASLTHPSVLSLPLLDGPG